MDVYTAGVMQYGTECDSKGDIWTWANSSPLIYV